MNVKTGLTDSTGMVKQIVNNGTKTSLILAYNGYIMLLIYIYIKYISCDAMIYNDW